MCDVSHCTEQYNISSRRNDTELLFSYHDIRTNKNTSAGIARRPYNMYIRLTQYRHRTPIRIHRQVTSSGKLIIYSGTTKTKGHRMITARFPGDNRTATIRSPVRDKRFLDCLPFGPSRIREKSVYRHEWVYPRDRTFRMNRTRVQQHQR